MGLGGLFLFFFFFFEMLYFIMLSCHLKFLIINIKPNYKSLKTTLNQDILRLISNLTRE